MSARVQEAPFAADPWLWMGEPVRVVGPRSLQVVPIAPPHGRFEILSRLAVGGMAEVFLARDAEAPGPDKRVAVKRMLERHAKDPTLRALFGQEAEIHAQLDHPNVPGFVAAGEVDGLPYLGVELVEGATLTQLGRIARSAGAVVEVEAALRIAVDILDALDHVHRRARADGSALGLVHCDVSPMNVMVSESGVVKLIDFGVCTMNGGADLGARPFIRGKVPYVAPERFQGRAPEPASDLWSAGVVIYELLAGHPLFAHRARSEQVRQVLTMQVRPIRLRRPDVPEGLALVLDTLLSRDLRARYSAAEEARGELIACAAGLGLDISRERLSHHFADLRRACVAAAGGLPTSQDPNITQKTPSPGGRPSDTRLRAPKSRPSSWHAPAPEGPGVAPLPQRSSIAPGESLAPPRASIESGPRAPRRGRKPRTTVRPPSLAVRSTAPQRVHEPEPASPLAYRVLIAAGLVIFFLLGFVCAGQGLGR